LLMGLICLALARRSTHARKGKASQSQLTEYTPNDKVKTAAAVAKIARDAERDRMHASRFSFNRLVAFSCIGLVCLSSIIMSWMAIIGTGSFRSSDKNTSTSSLSDNSIDSLLKTQSVADAGSLFSNQVPAGMAYRLLTEYSGLSMLNDLDFSDGSRYEGHNIDQIRNAQWLYGVCGFDYAGSRYNQNIEAFQNSVGLSSNLSAYCYSGLDQRSELLALLDVNHFLTDAKTDIRDLPAGFSQVSEQSSGNAVDQSRKSVSYAPIRKNSLFYTFNRAITEKTYYTLSPLERQQALMQAIVQSDSSSSDTVSSEQLMLDPGKINYSMETGDGVELTKVIQKSTGSTSYMISVNRGGAYLDLILDTPLYAEAKNPEVYVYMKNLAFTNGSLESYKITVQEMYRQKPVSNGSRVLNGLTPYSTFYTKKSDRLLNIGRTAGSTDKIRLYFNTAGTYTLDDIQVLKRSCEGIEENINALDNRAENVKVQTNAYSCDVEMNEEGYLFASIPYSTGWVVYDNEKLVSPEKTDLAFMSVYLGEGKHHISLYYLTPGILPGLYVSIFSILIWIVVFRKQRNAG
ncbi:MAG: YfhO family protein, partial [Bilifractor sp.]